jgi:uncharacterized protein
LRDRAARDPFDDAEQDIADAGVPRAGSDDPRSGRDGQMATSSTVGDVIDVTTGEPASAAERGLDDHGYIRPEVSLAFVAGAYRPVIAELREQNRIALGDHLHSLYLTGSVVKGTARPGVSDLDALAVVRVTPAPEHEEAAHRVARVVAERFPFLTDVSLLLFDRATVLSEAQRYDMGFFVKCLCACVDGEDLGNRLGRYRPSVALARGTNGNIRRLLADRRRRLETTIDPAEVASICRGIMRKIVRTGFTMVMPRYQGWTSDLEPAVTIFASYYPEQAGPMRVALALAQAPSTEKTRVIDLLDSMGLWLADEYDRVIMGAR